MDTPVAWPALPGPTGDGNVDGILADLAQLPGLPTGEHAAHYEQIHDDLLADLDAGSGAGTD
ncbi:hypothetical protein [Arthrobacter mobilis]|uniref:Uncharacterized protein n=1 Tax=Arthrobacter mobilis TaxID=2724944 RepID=A0A7X6K7X6_9MICC|nr:hypothetical protein [Arthrobacter mobilis]NKX56814.1 hypothetical protein [Arthrobacter mobilis]